MNRKKPTIKIGKGIEHAVEHRCPYCDHPINASSQIHEDGTPNATPNEGDFSICAYCGAVGVFNADGSCRKATDAEKFIAMTSPLGEAVMKDTELFAFEQSKNDKLSEVTSTKLEAPIPINCPYCGHTSNVNACNYTQDEIKKSIVSKPPKEGDMVMCSACGELGVMEDCATARKATDAEKFKAYSEPEIGELMMKGGEFIKLRTQIIEFGAQKLAEEIKEAGGWEKFLLQ